MRTGIGAPHSFAGYYFATSLLNKYAGYHFKQVLLNDVVIWEDDVAGDEEWQQVKIPISLEGGKNRIMLRVYEKQVVGGFRVNVWWDDVKIEPFSELLREGGTEFNICDPSGGEMMRC